MSDNVKPFRPGLGACSDPERECLLTEQKIDEAKDRGFSPKGIVFVLFSEDGDGQLCSSAHWLTEFIDSPGAFVAAYAAAKIHAEIGE